MFESKPYFYGTGRRKAQLLVSVYTMEQVK